MIAWLISIPIPFYGESSNNWVWFQQETAMFDKKIVTQFVWNDYHSPATSNQGNIRIHALQTICNLIRPLLWSVASWQLSDFCWTRWLSYWGCWRIALSQIQPVMGPAAPGL